MCELCNQRVMLREMAAHRHMNCHTAKVDEHPKPVYDKAGLNYGIARSGVSRVVDSRFMFPLPMPGEEAGSPMQGKYKHPKIDWSWLDGINMMSMLPR